MPIEQSTGDMVVAIAEDRRSYAYRVAENSFCGIAAAIDLRFNFFDNDTLPAFNRFHITQIFRFNVSFPMVFL